MARVEAVLLVAEGAISARKIAQFATLSNLKETWELVAQLNNAYDNSGSAFRIEQVATGYQMMTRPEYSFWLDKLHDRHSAMKLSPSALETLTIVAYRQPVTRADVESIRGVQSAEMLKQLMERGLVRIGGEEDSLGLPYLYVTTRLFLETYGLQGLEDLPLSEELRRRPSGQNDAIDEDTTQEYAESDVSHIGVTDEYDTSEYVTDDDGANDDGPEDGVDDGNPAHEGLEDVSIDAESQAETNSR